MYAITIVSALLLIGISALPQVLEQQETHQLDEANVAALQPIVEPYFLGTIVQKAIEYFLKKWDDPYQSCLETIDISLPDGSAHINGEAKVFTVAGFSKIQLNKLNWRLLPPRLEFDIYVPHINVSTELFNGVVFIDSQFHKVEASGWVCLEDVNIIGVARVSLGNLIQITDVDSALTFGSVESNIVVHLAGVDYSSQANDFISNSLHGLLVAHNDILNKFLRFLLQSIL